MKQLNQLPLRLIHLQRLQQLLILVLLQLSIPQEQQHLLQHYQLTQRFQQAKVLQPLILQLFQLVEAQTKVQLLLLIQVLQQPLIPAQILQQRIIHLL